LRIRQHWLGSGGVRVDAPGVYHYVVNRAADSIIRPEQPGEGALVPVVTSPGLGRVGATVGLRVGDSVLPATIVAHARYFPSIDGDFAVADLPTWLAAANAAEPGVAAPSELWTEQRPPALPLQVTSQRATERALRDDPIARGAIVLLLVVALVSLLLAVAGLVLTVLADRSGERSSLRDLEVQGATPAQQRRHLRLRAAVTGVLGVGGGIGAGAIVGTLVVAVVTVTAGAETALPPLALVFDWPLVALAVGAVAAVSTAAAVAATRRLR
ncbi:MAG TPA: FtsX-like permease family protein, partial [Gaiellaceae bacterium]